MIKAILNDYLKFNKIVACGGSWMVKPELLKRKDFNEIKRYSVKGEVIMIPTRKQTEEELKSAGQLNPGLWEQHAKNVGRAAEEIAKHCKGLDSDKAYVLGCLHDIGRRAGIVGVKHIIAGYDYAMGKGWDEVARVCLTHSYSHCL